MKLNIYKFGTHCYIAFEKYQRDYQIAKILSLTLEEYKNILLNYNACQPDNTYEDYYFYYQKDALKAIKKLEPLVIIMATLTE